MTGQSGYRDAVAIVLVMSEMGQQAIFKGWLESVGGPFLTRPSMVPHVQRLLLANAELAA